MLENIKKWSMVLGTVMLLASCSTDMEDVNPSTTLGAVSSDAAKVASTTSPLTISDLSTTDGKTWSFTVQKTATGNVPNIGSLLLTLTGCDDQQIALSGSNVVSASVTGAATQALVPSYKEGNGSACDMSAVTGYLRLTDFTEKLTDGKVYTISFTLSQAIKFKTASVWTRISNNCYNVAVNGPGCEVEDLCGLGQGNFKDVGSWKGHSITLGGETYTEEQGLNYMNPTSEFARGNKYAMFAFSQGATLVLNRAQREISETAYQEELDAINAYLKTLGRFTPSIAATEYDNSTLAQAAKKAAGDFGKLIKCENGE